MRIVSGASTDTGQVRDGNEDSYLVDRRLDLFAVADGMGGHRAGEIASATALDGLRLAVDEGTPVADAVGRANTAVWDKAARRHRARAAWAPRSPRRSSTTAR